MGQAARAEVIEDDGSKTRRRALLCTGIVIVLGSVLLGTRYTSSNTRSVPATTAPTISSAPSETPSLRPSPTPSISQTPTVDPLGKSFFDLFVSYNTSIQALQDLSSPQHEALIWMTNNDSTDLQVKVSDDELVERFVLVILYTRTTRTTRSTSLSSDTLTCRSRKLGESSRLSNSRIHLFLE
jgi:hypothetical protein